jgi:site-specific DNA-methyltransferase (cytosine-N4-specific)
MNNILENRNNIEVYGYTEDIKTWIAEWTFKNYKTDIYTHKIHKYPAMFIPQIARKLILTYSAKNDTVLDLFNGSGTTAVECNLLNRKSFGIELNPLAILISKVKTTPINYKVLISTLDLLETSFFHHSTSFTIKTFKNIEYWYSNDIIIWLSKLVDLLNKLEDPHVSDFFKVCLSEILREVSWCKHSGFKMHRDTKKMDKKLCIKSFFSKFKSISISNIDAIKSYTDTGVLNQSTVFNHNSTQILNDIPPCSVDLILTSPPYGDSQTTVAYGQYSRLSMQWLNLNPIEGDIHNLDKSLLGGKPKKNTDFSEILNYSATLKNAFLFYSALATSHSNHPKIKARLDDVLTFYRDLYLALKNGCYYKLHTDIIISEFAEHLQMTTQSIFYRKIENKRIPHKVSATNIAGEVSPTMTKESIIILRKH